jgi:hypothetical protein
VKKLDLCCIRRYENSILKGEGEERGNENIMGAVSLLNAVLCMHIRKYHHEIPLYYYCLLIQKIVFKKQRSKATASKQSDLKLKQITWGSYDPPPTVQ